MAMKRKSAFVGGGPVVGKVQRKASAIVSEVLSTPAGALRPQTPAASAAVAGAPSVPKGEVEPGSIWDFGDRVPGARHAFKALCTDELTAALLGDKGRMKDQIQQETGSKLVFSNRGDYFPQTTYRVLGIYANEITVFHGAFERILQRIVEHGKEEQAAPAAQAEYVGKEPGEFVFRLCLTHRMASQMIGTQGANISWIRKDTGAKVFIENDIFKGHRMARVVGQPERILKCLNHINEFVQMEGSQPYYAPFFGIVNFSDKDERRIEDMLHEADAPKGGGKKGEGAGKKGGNGAAAGTGAGKGPERSAGSAATPPRRSAIVGGGGAVGGAGGGGGPQGGAVVGGPVLRAVTGGGAQALRSWQSAVPPRQGATSTGKGGRAGSAGPRPRDTEADIDALLADLEAFPEGAAASLYSIDCRLEMREGIDSEFLAFVKDSTDADVQLHPIQGQQEMHQVTVVGVLPNVYVAHAMLLQRALSLAASGGAADHENEPHGDAEDWDLQEMDAMVDAIDDTVWDREVLKGYIVQLDERHRELMRYISEIS